MGRENPESRCGDEAVGNQEDDPVAGQRHQEAADREGREPGSQGDTRAISINQPAREGRNPGHHDQRRRARARHETPGPAQLAVPQRHDQAQRGPGGEGQGQRQEPEAHEKPRPKEGAI